MPRIARRAADGGVYHILNRGNGQQRVFHKDADYLAFVGLLKELQKRFAIELYAYCLIPNHFHLLVRAVKGGDLARGMHWFTTSHVRCYHRHYRSSGHIWQGRYKSFGIEDDDHLLTVARYVEGNPVRAGLVETATAWLWSSHRERCGLEREGVLAPFPIDLARGLAPQGACPRSRAWTTFIDTPLTAKELAKVRKKVERQTREGDELLH